MKTFAAALVACCLPLYACSGSETEQEKPLEPGKGPVLDDQAAGDDFMEGEEPGSASGDSAGGGESCAAAQFDNGCAGETYAGEIIPLDIYVMFDQSGSMCSCVEPGGSQTCPDPACGETRLDAVRRAMGAFLADTKSAGIGVGLGHFGKQAIGQASCAASDYEAPAVGVGTLPEHASTLMSSLEAVAPTGETPTGAAIRGACSYSRAHQQSAPGHQVVMLLLTDGKPEAPATCQNGSGACCPTLNDAVTAAEDCRAGGIPTYVLGVGPLLENLNQIAAAGGTNEAYLVEGGDVSTQVLEALNRIRGAAIPCQLDLPKPRDGQELKLDEVNLAYQSSECEPTPFLSVRSAAECGTEDGWYYDDPANPQRIELCPRSCDRVAAPGGSLTYSVGCATQFRIR